MREHAGRPATFANKVTGEKLSDAANDPPIRTSEEGHMCPACIARTAVMVAGAGSAGGILTLCIGEFRKFFKGNHLGLFQKTKEK
jgi:hypothetical protein